VRQLSQFPSQPYIQGVEGVRAVGAFVGGEILAFGRMQGSGMMPSADGNFSAPLITKKVREVSVKVLSLANNGIQNGIRIQNTE